MNETEAVVKPVRTTRQFNLVSALLAFVLWGGWAFYVNSRQSTETGVLSGVAQGTASFLITLFMVRVVARLFRLFQHPLARLFLPALLTVSFTSLCLVIIHSVIETPHIFQTISPALTVAFCFCVYTSYQLLKMTRQQDQVNE